MLYVIASLALAVAWIPLFLRFLRGWKNRKNPVSLAICATISFLIYVNVMTATVALKLGDWQTVRILNLFFDGLVVVNFYVSFHWSNQRFPDARRSNYSVPPTNVSKDSQD